MGRQRDKVISEGDCLILLRKYMYGKIIAHNAVAVAHKMSSQNKYYDGLRRVMLVQFPVRNVAIIQNTSALTRSFP